jgi:hypothetical protein
MRRLRVVIDSRSMADLDRVILKQVAKIQLLEMENNSLKHNLDKAADDAIAWRELALSKPPLPPLPPVIILADNELRQEINSLEIKLRRRAYFRLLLRRVFK